MDQHRRLALLAAASVVGIAGAARAASKPAFMSKDGKSVEAKRTFTDADGKTHCGIAEWQGTRVDDGEETIVPPGCTRYYEGKALGMLIRRFIPGMKTDYHTDPANEHQVAFMIDGEAAVGAKDGSSFHLKAGEFASVEDDHGEGHTAIDATGRGFTQLFVSVPAVG